RVGAIHAPRSSAEVRERQSLVIASAQRADDLGADQSARSRDRHAHAGWMRERSDRFASALLSAPVNELCWVSLQVPDLERSRALGSSQEIPGGVSRDFEDPDGYLFELVELRERAEHK